VRLILEGKRGRRRGGSTVSETDHTMKSGSTVGEAEGGDLRLEVKDDQRKLGRWAECVVGLNCWLGRRKKYG
jgi:hypothetical protein